MRKREGKYDAGGRALQDDYNDIIDDVLAGWDVADNPQDGVTLPADALEQIEAALKAYDPSLEQTGVQDIIDTYFEHAVASEEDTTLGDIEDEAFDLAADGWDEDTINHRLVQKHGMDKGTIENIRAYEAGKLPQTRTREAAGKYVLRVVKYSRGDIDRLSGSFKASSDEEACKKAAMIQANYGPLKGLDAEAIAELEHQVVHGYQKELKENPDPIKAWGSWVTYNSEEFEMRLTAPDGRVLFDTGIDDDYEEADFDESKKTSVGSILREAAKPVQQDKLRSWYKQSFKESYRNNNGYELVDLEEGSAKPGKLVLKEAVDAASAYARLMAITERRGRVAGTKQAERYVQLAQEKAARFAGEVDDARELYESLEHAWLDGALQGFESRKNDSAFTNDRKATENKEVYQVRESRVAKKPRVKESVPNWYEFQSDVFNAINEVYEKYNMGNAAEKVDKMDMIKVLTEWISMVTETKKASNSYKYNH